MCAHRCVQMILANLCCRPLHEVVCLSRCSFLSRLYTSVCQRGGSKRIFSSHRVFVHSDASQWQHIASIRDHGVSRADTPPPELPGCLHTHTQNIHIRTNTRTRIHTRTHYGPRVCVLGSIFIDLITYSICFGMTYILQHTATQHINTLHSPPLVFHRVYCLEFRGG